MSHIPNTSLRCSNQPLWKLNLMTGVNMTISLKKFVFSNVALVHVNLVPRIFLPKKETGEKHNFHKFLYQVNTPGNVTESCRLSACNFDKNELLLSYFSRILTANFKTPLKWLLLQRRIQDLVKMELFCEYNKRLKAVNYFHKKAPSQMFHKVLYTPLF